MSILYAKQFIKGYKVTQNVISYIILMFLILFIFLLVTDLTILKFLEIMDES